MKKLISLLIGLGVVASLRADPIVIGVKVRQNLPWDTRILVTYDVFQFDGCGSVCPKVELRDGVRRLEVPADAISGETRITTEGEHLLEIDATKITGVDCSYAADFSVAVSLVEAQPDENEVLYKVVDLTNGAITDLTRGMLASGDYGTVESNYEFAVGENLAWLKQVHEPDVFVWTGVTNDIAYKTTKLVLRRIPAGVTTMDAGDVTDEMQWTSPVRITRDFYLGVFEMTQAQCELIKSGLTTSYYTNPTYKDIRPADSVSFPQIRGNSKGYKWPINFNRTVDDNTFVKSIRDLTGKSGFDLPTEAQWELARRATTLTAYNNGYNLKDDAVAGKWVCRNKSSSGGTKAAADSDLSVGTAAVGTYFPNAWGLYDMHGNVWEWVLDAEGDGTTLPTGIDPVGPEAPESPGKYTRILKGGCYTSGNTNVRSGNRLGYANTTTKLANYASYMGFRLALNLD